MFKPHETRLRFKYIFKQVTITCGKTLQLIKTVFWEKWDESFKTVTSTIYGKYHSRTSKSRSMRSWLYQAGWLSKRDSLFSRKAEDFRLHGTERACFHYP